MKLSDVMAGIEYRIVQGDSDTQIESLTNDSREVERDSLFFCVPGFKLDGHAFAGEAAAKGAVAIIAEKQVKVPSSVTVFEVDDVRLIQGKAAANFYNITETAMKLAGITGTNGKTTTTYIIEQILTVAGLRPGIIGTVEYRFGGRAVPAERTTPDSLFLHRLLHQMSDAGVDAAIIEVSSHALDLARVDELRFDAVAFTNLSQDHLDYHEDLEAYFQAKARLFTIHSGKKKRPAFCINIDDGYGQRLERMLEAVDYRFGLSEAANVRGGELDIRSTGTTFNLVTPIGEARIRSSLLGSFNVYNALAAASVCMSLGIGFTQIVSGLEREMTVPGRFEVVDCGQGFVLAIDYAHTPDGLKNILCLAREIAGSHRVITVFGCGGDRDRTKRPLMGKAVSELSDVTIVTSDNPRSEEPEAIIEEILGGIDGSTDCITEADRRKAIVAAIGTAESGDVIIVAGKGHEAYQEIKGQMIPFSDRIVAMEVLEEAGLCSR